MMKIRIAASLCLVCLSAFCIQTFLYPASFNKQRIKRFDWKIVSTDHFDIYYYPETIPLLPQAKIYVEKAYQKLMAFYGLTYPRERVPFFLFLDHNEFEQNNVVDVGEGTGGVTEAFKNRLSVYNSGSQVWLEYVITHEMSHIIQFYVLYGGFWKSVRLLKSFFYPLWAMEGLAEYGTDDLDRTTREMYIRDAATSKGLIPLQHLHNFSHLKPHQITLAYKESEMAIRFLADEYGIEKILKLLPVLKTRFDAHSVMYDLIGTDLFKFNKKFVERTEEEYREISKDMQEPDVYGSALSRSDRIPQFNTNPVFSPNSDDIAYISDRKGVEEIYTYNIKTKQQHVLITNLPDACEQISAQGHALSYSLDGRFLAFIGEDGERDFIYEYDTLNRKIMRYKCNLEQIASPAYSPDGTAIALIGMHNGFTDIYLFNRQDHSLQQITHDENDDNYAVFSPDGKSLVYSTEVAVSSGTTIQYKRDIAEVFLESREPRILISLPGDEEEPCISPDNTVIYFINDQDSIRNLYAYNRVTQTTVKLTNVIGGNYTPAVSSDGTKMVFASFRKGNTLLYVTDISSLNTNISSTTMAYADIYNRDLTASVTIPFNIEASSTTLPRPYRFSASTDLFFPLLYYSSLDGFFTQIYWQASEMLGNHQMLANVGFASGESYLNYSFAYQYLKFKPSLYFAAEGENYYEDFEQLERRIEHSQYIGASYPLSRYVDASLETGTVARTARYRVLDNLKLRDRENFIAAELSRNITTGRYLDINRGYTARVRYEISKEDALDSDYDYQNHIFEGSTYLPVSWTTMAIRGLGGVSFGATPGYFRLGGVDRMRGFPRNSDAYKSSRALLVNYEWRIPAANLNYYVWYLFPDLFFKQMTIVLFTDSGYLWEKGSELRSAEIQDVHNSVGIGVRFNTFVLQMFRFDLSFDWAKRTSDGKDIFYFSFGPEF